MKSNLKHTFIENEKSLNVLRSAEEVIKCIICNEKVLDKHKKGVISLMIWMVTERYGKYNTRYRSEKTKEMICWNRGMRHEHINGRKGLICDMLKNPKKISVILENAIACVVTKEEHEILNKIDKNKPNLKGWERYKEAKIKVYDMQMNKFLEW